MKSLERLWGASSLRHSLLAVAAFVLLVSSCLAPDLAFAQGANGVLYNGSPIQALSGAVYQSANVTASSTFATNTFADLAGSAITWVPTPNDPTVNKYGVRIRWSLDVGKATATTLVCGVYVNGALVTASERTFASAAVRGTMGGIYVVALTSAGSQTIKLQCESGDTNTGTVYNGVIEVDANTGGTPYNP